MSIVRIGLAETKHFAEGYEAIFGKKKNAEGKREEAAARTGTAKKKKKPKKK
ncbi:MAG TPA: hypothetical protein VKI65_04610 [Gemmataceae bacterium]|nr:hypothetical protein [Gemmataceae bacterium]